jgi:uncharacterized protein (UPF0333 family)
MNTPIAQITVRQLLSFMALILAAAVLFFALAARGAKVEHTQAQAQAANAAAQAFLACERHALDTGEYQTKCTQVQP